MRGHRDYGLCIQICLVYLLKMAKCQKTLNCHVQGCMCKYPQTDTATENLLKVSYCFLLLLCSNVTPPVTHLFPPTASFLKFVCRTHVRRKTQSPPLRLPLFYASLRVKGTVAHTKKDDTYISEFPNVSTINTITILQCNGCGIYTCTKM